MKLVKTTAIAVAISALLAAPVLAQGASDAPARGGSMGKTQMQQGGADADAPAGGTHKAAKAGSKTTVGTGSGAKGSATTPPASR